VWPDYLDYGSSESLVEMGWMGTDFRLLLGYDIECFTTYYLILEAPDMDG